MLLEIAPVTDAGTLPSCTPSLMPFRISYTGSAPISRYFRPRPAPPLLNALSLRSSSSATLVASSSASILGETESRLTTASSTTSIVSVAHENERREGSLVSAIGSSVQAGAVRQADQTTAAQPAMETATEADPETQPASDAIPPDNTFDPRWTGGRSHTSSRVERFVAAFRGRQMYGQAVGIPSGYVGLVLRAPLDPKGKNKEDVKTAKPKSKTRASMRRVKRAAADVTPDESEGGDGGDCQDADAARTRGLVPSSTFSSFMLWTPDRPLDEGSDEYARALVEWTNLATEIHSCDE